jgi:hypothetical protein
MALQRYRLRIFDGQYEVLHKASFYVNVDLDSPEAGGVLDRQFIALIRRARVENEPMDQPILKICDHATGKTIWEWA